MLNTKVIEYLERMLFPLKDKKVVGIGNTATVYELSEGKVLKLFHKGYPRDSVHSEFKNAKALEKMKFSKPQAHEIVTVKDQSGIIYDYVHGDSLQEWVLKTGKLEGCASHMANLHKQILSNRFDKGTNYKDILKHNIMKAQISDSENIDKILYKLNDLPEGNILCHGDFHPGNIVISHGNPVILDFMNLCSGVYLFDVARTVYLVEYTPVSASTEDKEVILKLKKALTDSYLRKMDVTRDLIQDFIEVIEVARRGECPDEAN